MNDIAAFVAMMAFLISLIVTRQFFFYLSLHIFTKYKVKQLGIELNELHYSFEQMVYFITLPSHLPAFLQAEKNDLTIKRELDGWLFPSFKGIKILLEKGNEHHLISYLPIDQFRLPVLDQLEQQGKIDEDTYHKICAYKLLENTTLQDVLDAVYKRIHAGHYA